MSRTTPGPCCDCGRSPRPPRTALPTHTAYGDPVCNECLAIERGVEYVAPGGPEPLTEYEIACQAAGHRILEWRGGMLRERGER